MLGATLSLAPLGVAADAARSHRMSSDMQRAIAFQRAKDRADARQARREARHPSVAYSNNSANRSIEETPSGRAVRDPGEPAYRRHRQDRSDRQDRRDRQDR